MSGAVADGSVVEGSLVGDEVAEVVALGVGVGDEDAEVAVAFAVAAAGGEAVGETGLAQVQIPRSAGPKSTAAQQRSAAPVRNR